MVDASDYIDDYDAKNVSEVDDALDDGDFDADALRDIRAYEAAHKDRSTVLAAVDAHLRNVADDDAEDDADEDGDEADVEEAADEAESDADDDAEMVWISPHTAQVGSHLFRTLYSPQKVELTRAVKQALENGRATRVDPPEGEE